MACNANKVPFLRTIAKRGLATNQCPRPLGQAAEVKTTVLNNKLVVATAEASLPITRVSIVFRAGSRNESYENQGSAHLLRIASGLSTKNTTAFAINRNIQQVGGSLSATSDRELVTYTVETTSNQIETGLRFLQDLVQPAFKPWELSDIVSQVKSQIASVTPQERAVELLHKAAFRSGLGNSIHIPKFQIGKLSSESLLHYVNNNFIPSRCAVVGVGIDHNTLSGFAQNLELSSGSGKSDSASYYGGDARKDTAGVISHVAVAGQGASLLNQKEALAFAVLKHAVGAGAATKRGNVNGPFGKAIQGAVTDASISYAPLNASYADAGLFGFLVSTDVQHIGKAVDALTRALKSGSVSSNDVNRGKALLKAALLESYATDSSLINEISVQAVHTKQVHNIEALLSAVDGVTQQDVQQAAKKAGSSKLSVGAVGNLANVPYASDLS
ncbi:cytochrome b-c1 complex subunit 2, mitochondrial [Rhagoletis pomonella]|uniref:cytochrome b-c1 complex subunit 2, mitochondrial n=1 Tax=Rhagoletis pomonella TaxID=28610 RepID=UPI00177D6432|nr:cytochrome b-c1 complex subunit 2, mitochondrial [Rhagoletis pomonella]